MALRQQPDRLKVPCRAGVGTASIPFLQLNNAQMIRHMCHGSPSAIHGTPIYMLRSILGIPDESITRNPYQSLLRPRPCTGISTDAVMALVCVATPVWVRFWPVADARVAGLSVRNLTRFRHQ